MTRFCWDGMSVRCCIFSGWPTDSFMQRNWPKNFYSALAGFVEPGESLEDTVERELWEEAGIKVLGLKYHSTQPWVSFPRPFRSPCSSALRQPFPANIMAGFYAIADPNEPVRTDLDNELEGESNALSPANMYLPLL